MNNIVVVRLLSPYLNAKGQVYSKLGTSLLITLITTQMKIILRRHFGAILAYVMVTLGTPNDCQYFLVYLNTHGLISSQYE